MAASRVGRRAPTPMFTAARRIWRASTSRTVSRASRNQMVFRLLRQAGLGPRVASLLTILMTRKGHIPQGAPTSDRLANLVLTPVDQRVREYCRLAEVEQPTLRGRLHAVGRGHTRGDRTGDRGAAGRGLRRWAQEDGERRRDQGARRDRLQRDPAWPEDHPRETAGDSGCVSTRPSVPTSGESPSNLSPALVHGSLVYLRRTNPGLTRRLTNASSRTLALPFDEVCTVH